MVELDLFMPGVSGLRCYPRAGLARVYQFQTDGLSDEFPDLWVPKKGAYRIHSINPGDVRSCNP
jgi:hypothetical protein